MESYDSFGEWLRQRRRALDLTQAELSQCAGYSVSALRKVETDERRPSRQGAELLAQCLRIPPEQRSAFVKAARGVERVERLGGPLTGLEVVPSKLLPLAHSLNLPIPATPLVGRERELAALAGLLRDPRCRLLTIVGPGGIGKTHLAIEAASMQRQQFADGTYFVPLASLTSHQHIIPAVADVLGFGLAGAVEPRVQLLNHLRAKSLLLVLDNFEHLLEAGGLLAELLQQSPAVKLLVTSRERLDLQAEWLFDLQGLPVPPSEQLDSAEEYSAVELFVQSARRLQPGFALQADERLAVSRICQLVEGMPLAIELAAAWVRVLDCVDIASEIESSLDFLVRRVRDLPERHHSLRAVFDHSWNLLSSSERSLLCQLAVFQGSFELEAAEQVAGASLSSLSALVSKSLVRSPKNGRFDLHEVVRQFALSRLADDPQSEATRDRHCDFYLAFLKDREKGLRGAAQRKTLRELTNEIDNVRAAWTWAVQRGRFDSLGPAVRCFGWLYEMRGWFREGFEQLELVVQGVRGNSEDEVRQKVLGQAMAQQGLLLFRQGESCRAQTLLAESLSILRHFDDPALLLDPLIFSGVIMFLHGEMERAQARLEECLACARAAEEPWFAAYALYDQGYVASLLGRYDEGYEQMLAGLAEWRALGDSRHAALGLNHISPTAIRLGRYEEAQAFLQESLMLCTRVDDRWGMGTAYRQMGLLALARGDPVEAQSLIHKSLDLFTGLITGWDVVQSLVYLGKATAAAGDASEARRIFLDALDQAVEVRAYSLASDALIELACLQAQAGEAEQAWDLSTCVMGHPASTQEARDRAEQLCIQLAPLLLPGQQAESPCTSTEDTRFEEIVEKILGRAL
jgi:predicted ATPase/transcriptional regulator with XRE-family HTH domain